MLLNNKKGGFTQAPANFGALSIQPILVDVNGDGKLDLILSYTGGLFGNPQLGATLYMGNGTGGFTFGQTFGYSISSPSYNFVADVNGDGIPDILVLQHDTIEIFLGEGTSSYATAFSIGTGPSPDSILIENLHGQSAKADLPDIVVPDASGGVLVLLNLTP